MSVLRIHTVAVDTTQVPSGLTCALPVFDRCVLVAFGTDVFHIEVMVLEGFW